MATLGVTPYNQQPYIKCNISNGSVIYVLCTDNSVVPWVGFVSCDKNFFEHQLHFSKWNMSVVYFE